MTLTDTQEKDLVLHAEIVREADCQATAARARQNALWRRLVSQGVTKTAIAEMSGLTLTAVSMRLGKT